MSTIRWNGWFDSSPATASNGSIATFTAIMPTHMKGTTMSTITLDMLTSMIREERADATPAEQGLILANAIRSIDAAYVAEAIAAATPVQSAPAPRKPRKSADKADWKTMPVGKSQLARMNRLETALNAHYGEDCALSEASDFANKGDLSAQYQALAAEGNKLGLTWAA